MKLLTVLLVVAFVLGTLSFSAGVALAQQVPNVAGLQPFTAQTNYMSLAGYLRWLIFQQTGQWITRQEAVRLVAQQGG